MVPVLPCTKGLCPAHQPPCLLQPPAARKDKVNPIAVSLSPNPIRTTSYVVRTKPQVAGGWDKLSPSLTPQMSFTCPGIARQGVLTAPTALQTSHRNLNSLTSETTLKFPSSLERLPVMLSQGVVKPSSA